MTKRKQAEQLIIEIACGIKILSAGQRRMDQVGSAEIQLAELIPTLHTNKTNSFQFSQALGGLKHLNLQIRDIRAEAQV